MSGEMTVGETLIAIWLTIFPFLIAWVVYVEAGKTKEKFHGLPTRHIPASAYGPAFAKSFAIGVLSFLMIIGLSHLPF